VRGLLAHEWWWRYLFDVHGGLPVVVREWLRGPRCVPAVMAWLARRRADAVAVAGAIAAEDARRVVEAVLREHALPSVAYAVVRALSQSAGTAVRHRPAQPHWIELVPEALEPALPIEQQLLIAVPLLLQRAPAMVRAPAFETTIVRWIAARRLAVAQPGTEELPRGRTPRRTRAKKPSTAATTQSLDEPMPFDEAAAPATTEPPQVEPTERSAKADAASERSADARRHGAHETTTIRHRRHTGPHRAHAGTPLRTAVTHEPRETPAPEEAHLAWPPPTHEELRGDAVFDPAPPPEAEFTSDFAGAFFLFNAGIALGFYSDFTSPTQQGIGLDIFLFVDRLGRALAGNAFARDPLHAFLRRSASHAPRWTPTPVLAAYPGAPRRDRWIAAVANHLRLRLGAGLARQLVTVPGRITTSLLHLDVHFSLAAHPIEIRIAGLDRNPGWIPAAGRHVAFHFD
jgi:hypothetical protein